MIIHNFSQLQFIQSHPTLLTYSLSNSILQIHIFKKNYVSESVNIANPQKILQYHLCLRIGRTDGPERGLKNGRPKIFGSVGINFPSHYFVLKFNDRRFVINQLHHWNFCQSDFFVEYLIDSVIIINTY